MSFNHLDLRDVTHIHTTMGTLLHFSQCCGPCFVPWDEVDQMNLKAYFSAQCCRAAKQQATFQGIQDPGDSMQNTLAKSTYKLTPQHERPAVLVWEGGERVQDEEWKKTDRGHC